MKRATFTPLSACPKQYILFDIWTGLKLFPLYSILCRMQDYFSERILVENKGLFLRYLLTRQKMCLLQYILTSLRRGLLQYILTCPKTHLF